VTDAFSWLSAEDDRTDPKQSPTPSTDDDAGDGNLHDKIKLGQGLAGK
jgi:hypothetical protein